MTQLSSLDNEGVSIVICTYNGRDRIVPTLNHLSHQRAITFPVEIVVVDNNSKDGTPTLVQETWNKLGSPFPLRIIPEPKPGTMYARLRGIQESKYRFMLYCDDDNWLNADYLVNALSMIKSEEGIAAVGGMGELVWDDGLQAPEWAEKYKFSYGAGPQGKEDGDITDKKGCLYTAGALIDRQWLNKLYQSGFRSSLEGRHSNNFVAGEDTELTLALRLIGGKLFFSSKLHFKHYMTPGRLQWKYMQKLWLSFGYSDFLISPYKEHFKNQENNFVKHVISISYALSKSLVKSCMHGFPEGDIYVIRLHRMYGGLKALFTRYEIYKRNKEMVKLLLSNSKGK